MPILLPVSIWIEKSVLASSMETAMSCRSSAYTWGEGLLLSTAQHKSSSLLSYPYGVYFPMSIWSPFLYSLNKHLNIICFPLCLPVFAKMPLVVYKYWAIFTCFKNLLPDTTEEKFQLFKSFYRMLLENVFTKFTYVIVKKD